NQTVASGSGQDITFPVADDVVYTAQLTVTDTQSNLSSSASTTVTGTEASMTITPIAPPTMSEGGSLTLSGVFSDAGTPAGGYTLTWHVVNTNPMGPTVADGHGQNFVFNPPDNSVYNITFTVAEAGGGAPTSTTTSVTVNNVAPKATLSASATTLNEGASATVSFGAVTDPGGTVDANAGFHYAFALTQSALNLFSYATAATANATTLSQLEEGAYMVFGRIFDKDNGYSDGSVSLTVKDLAVLPTGTTLSATEGSALQNATVATFSDPGGTEPLGDYAAAIDWGDGTTSTGAAVTLSYANGVFSVIGSH